MEYTLHQRGRASIEFLVDLGIQGFQLEQQADAFAMERGLIHDALPDDAAGLQRELAPAMRDCAEFRLARTLRDWQLERHGYLAIEAFEEIREELEPALGELDNGPTTIVYDPDLEPPAYWDGVEFHRTAGGWDGHAYMGFVHGELIHRKMVDESRAGVIFEQRASAARLIPESHAKKILEFGCASGPYTLELAKTWPEAEIWACDISARQLEGARRRANEHGLQWHLLQALAEDTKLDGEQFDCVTSYAVGHECPLSVQSAILAEAHRLLKPGGVVLFADIKAYHVQPPYERWKADFWNTLHGGDPYWRDYAATDQAALAREAGFADAEWFGVGETQYPWVLRARKPA